MNDIIDDDWQYIEFEDNSIGLERVLPDNTTFDILKYNIDEYSWMVRLYDDVVGNYRDITSYDSDLHYDNMDEAYDGLLDCIHMNFSHLLPDSDIMMASPLQAKADFLQQAAEYRL